MYDLPAGKGRHFLNQGGVVNAILGGWEVGVIITLQTGFPVDLTTGVDQVNNGEGGYDRPSYSGVTPLRPPNPGIHQWINPAAYMIPTSCTYNGIDTSPYCYGNVGRTTVYGPWLGSLDANVMKRFEFREGKYLQLRFEAFNATNHPNFDFGNSNFSSSNFGTITSTNTPMRELQLGLKFVY